MAAESAPAVRELVQLAEGQLGRSGAGPDADCCVGPVGLDQVRQMYAGRVQQGRRDATPTMHLPMRRPGPAGPGLDAQQQIVSAAITSGRHQAGLAMELGCGPGANSLALAAAHRPWQFVGLDLLPAHASAAQLSSLRGPNASFLAADFGQLPVAPATCALVFTVEGLGHAVDLAPVLAAVRDSRVRGGELVVIEIFRAPDFDRLPRRLRQLGATVERLLAFPALPSIDSWARVAASLGFAVARPRDLTPAVLPELSLVAAVGRQALRADADLPQAWLRFILAGLLTFHSLLAGPHRYAAIHLTRS